MTFIGCLIILAIIWACINFICALTRYKKIKKKFPHTHAAWEAKADIFLKPFFAVFGAFAIWAFTMLVLACFCWNVPIETEYRTTVTSDSQSVVFEEQLDNKYLVSVDGTEYTCAHVVISNDISSPQVKFVEHKTADNFYAKFFFDELTGFTSFYELHIPESYLLTNNS